MEAPPKLDRLERVTDLVLVLLEAQHPLTLDAIAHQVPGYPAEHSARRQAFERDKRLLRDEGIPVLTERLPGAEQYGYRIEREAFYLPDLDLEPDEQVALHLAVAGVHLGDPSGRDALLKLGAAGLGDVRPIASLVPPAALVELFEAVRTRAAATFAYRGGGGAPRVVAPVGLWFRFGHWYLVAWDVEREGVRTFRVDRIDGDVTRGEAGSGTVPDGVQVDVKAALPDEPWEAEGDDAVTMRVRVDALEARRVIDEVGEDKVVARAVDGSVDLELGVSSFTSIRSWVLGLLDHATILEPPAFRDELVAWLDAISNEEHTLPADPVVPAAPDEGSTGAAAGPRSAPGAETSRRLRRLLAVIGWLAQVGEAPTAEAAQRFGMDEQELVAELELAACCGTPPYTPDTLMEIEVSEHSVRAFLPPEYARPRRLTPAEGFAVAASARLLLAVPGSDNDALRRALAKLDAALGVTRGGRSRRGRAGALGRGAGGGGRGCGGLDRLPVRFARRAHHPCRRARAGDHDRRPLVSRCVLSPRGRHAPVQGRPDRCGARRRQRCDDRLRRAAGPAAARDVRAGARRGGGAVATGPRRRVGARIRAGPCGGP